MNERPFSKAGYCDVCTRWYEIPDSGNCDCGGKILLTPGTHFSRELIQVPRVELDELVKALQWSNQAMDAWSYDETLLDGVKETAAKFRAKYLP